MKLILFFEKYGFLLVLLYCLGTLSPDFSSKTSLMDLDLSELQKGQSGSNMTKQIFWISILSFYMTRIFSESFYKNFKKELHFCLGIGCAICFISILSVFWSLNPEITLKRSIFQFVFLSSVVLSFMFSFKHSTLANSVELSVIIVICLSLITILTKTGFTEGFALAGYLNSKNLLAINLMVLIVLRVLSQKLFSPEICSSNYLHYLVFFLLILTQSKTSIFLAILYIASINMLGNYSKPLITLLFACCFFVFIFIPSVSYYLNDFWHVALYLNDDELTGRGIIWDNLYYDMFFFSKVEWGYGYGSYFGVNQVPYFFDIEYSFLQFITSAHNGYIGLFIQFGFIGCIFLFSILFWVGKQFNHLLLTSALMIPIIHNITESSFYRDQNVVWFLFIILVCSVSLLRYGKVKGTQ